MKQRLDGLNWRNGALKRYRTICFAYHEKKCIACGFDKVVAVHHRDQNRKNNVSINLIPLCPNCHHMVHMNKYKAGIEQKIEVYIEQHLDQRNYEGE